MSRLIFALLSWLLLPVAVASETGVPLDSPDIALHDPKTLRRGAEIFADYCFGCHSLKHVRYSRLMKDLGLEEDEVRSIFRLRKQQKINDLIESAMDSGEAAQWFIIAPPDLSLTARAYGVDWVYTYLRSFYIDESRPLGVNNLLYKGAVMPHVLVEWQGYQKPVYKKKGSREVFAGFRLIKPGELSTAEFDSRMSDLVTFLAYTSEPVKRHRQRVGVPVLLFLLAFAAVSYRLKQEYWRDIH